MIECVTYQDDNKSIVRFDDLPLFCKINFFNPTPHPNLMASLVALVHTIINFVIHLLKPIYLDNQSPLTNVFKPFRVVCKLRRTIYNGFIVVN